jgi:hypothetical protein
MSVAEAGKQFHASSQAVLTLSEYVLVADGLSMLAVARLGSVDAHKLSAARLLIVRFAVRFGFHHVSRSKFVLLSTAAKKFVSKFLTASQLTVANSVQRLLTTAQLAGYVSKSRSLTA